MSRRAAQVSSSSFFTRGGRGRAGARTTTITTIGGAPLRRPAARGIPVGLFWYRGAFSYASLGGLSKRSLASTHVIHDSRSHWWCRCSAIVRVSTTNVGVTLSQPQPLLASKVPRGNCVGRERGQWISWDWSKVGPDTNERMPTRARSSSICRSIHCFFS